jgi:hypothetical protein
MFATAVDAYFLGCLAVPLSFALLAGVLRVRARRSDARAVPSK